MHGDKAERKGEDDREWKVAFDVVFQLSSFVFLLLFEYPLPLFSIFIILWNDIYQISYTFRGKDILSILILENFFALSLASSLQLPLFDEKKEERTGRNSTNVHRLSAPC